MKSSNQQNLRMTWKFDRHETELMCFLDSGKTEPSWRVILPTNEDNTLGGVMDITEGMALAMLAAHPGEITPSRD